MSYEGSPLSDSFRRGRSINWPLSNEAPHSPLSSTTKSQPDSKPGSPFTTATTIAPQTRVSPDYYNRSHYYQSVAESRPYAASQTQPTASSFTIHGQLGLHGQLGSSMVLLSAPPVALQRSKVTEEAPIWASKEAADNSPPQQQPTSRPSLSSSLRLKAEDAQLKSSYSLSPPRGQQVDSGLDQERRSESDWEAAQSELTALRKRVASIQDLLQHELRARALSDDALRALQAAQGTGQSQRHVEREEWLKERDELKGQLQAERERRIAAELTVQHSEALLTLTREEHQKAEKRWDTEKTQLLAANDAAQQERASQREKLHETDIQLAVLKATWEAERSHRASQSPDRQLYSSPPLSTLRAAVVEEERNPSVSAASMPLQVSRADHSGQSFSPTASSSDAARRDNVAATRGDAEAVAALRSVGMSDVAIALTAGLVARTPEQATGALEEVLAGHQTSPNRARLLSEWQRRGGDKDAIVSLWGSAIEHSSTQLQQAREAVQFLRSVGMSDAAIGLTAGYEATTTASMTEILNQMHTGSVPSRMEQLLQEALRRRQTLLSS